MDLDVKKILYGKINDAVDTVEDHLMDLYENDHKKFNRIVIRNFMRKRRKMERERLTLEQTGFLKILNKQTEKMIKMREEVSEICKKVSKIGKRVERSLSNFN